MSQVSFRHIVFQLQVHIVGISLIDFDRTRPRSPQQVKTVVMDQSRLPPTVEFEPESLHGGSSLLYGTSITYISAPSITYVICIICSATHVKKLSGSPASQHPINFVPRERRSNLFSPCRFSVHPTPPCPVGLRIPRLHAFNYPFKFIGIQVRIYPQQCIARIHQRDGCRPHQIRIR